MLQVKWIKLSTDIFNNRKIHQIEKMPDGDALIVIWLKLLILAGSINDCGLVYFTKDLPYTDQLLATEFDRPLATIQLALATFQSFGMIDIVDNVIAVSNWEKYQNAEGLDKIREQTKARVARYRANQKVLADCNVTSNVTVTQCNATDIEEDKEGEIDKELDIKSNKRTRFVKPTVEEVAEYCKERGNNIDPEHFVDYYDGNGWKVGRNSMKDWKATVRTWEKNGYSNIGNTKKAERKEREFIPSF